MADMKVELLDTMGSDLTVANAARVSFAKESDWAEEVDPDTGRLKFFLPETDAKLIAYLAKHKHWTPFSHCQATFRIKAPIFVARQLFKHKVGLTENEVSRRYVDETPELFWPKVWRQKSTGGAKQGSSKEEADLTCAYLTYGRSAMGVADFFDCALKLYDKLIENGVCPEQARMVLPQSMMTEWWWTGSLSAFGRVHGLRTDPHAQQETRDVALAIGFQLCSKFPESWQALCAEKALTNA